MRSFGTPLLAALVADSCNWKALWLQGFRFVTYFLDTVEKVAARAAGTVTVGVRYEKKSLFNPSLTMKAQRTCPAGTDQAFFNGIR